MAETSPKGNCFIKLNPGLPIFTVRFFLFEKVNIMTGALPPLLLPSLVLLPLLNWNKLYDGC